MGVIWLKEDCTRTEMITFLRVGEIDVEGFDRHPKGLMTLQDMHNKIREFDVILGFDQELKRTILCSTNAQVLIRCKGQELHEMRRIYTKFSDDGSPPIKIVVEDEQPWSVRETMKRNKETIEDTAIRGLFEELDLVVQPDKLIRVPSRPKVDKHPSTVFPDIWGYRTITKFELVVTSLPWQGTKKVRDNGVEIEFELVPSPEPVEALPVEFEDALSRLSST